MRVRCIGLVVYKLSYIKIQLLITVKVDFHCRVNFYLRTDVNLAGFM